MINENLLHVVSHLTHNGLISKAVETDKFVDTLISFADESKLATWLFDEVIIDQCVQMGIGIRDAEKAYQFLLQHEMPNPVNETVRKNIQFDILRNLAAEIRAEQNLRLEKTNKQLAVISDCYREEIPERAEELDKILSGEIPSYLAFKLQVGIPSDKMTLAQAMIHLIMLSKHKYDFTSFAKSSRVFSNIENSEEQQGVAE